MTTPDPRVDALLAEVTLIRRTLESFGTAWNAEATSTVTLPRDDSSTPAAPHAPFTEAPAPLTPPSAPRSLAESARAWAGRSTAARNAGPAGSASVWAPPARGDRTVPASRKEALPRQAPAPTAADRAAASATPVAPRIPTTNASVSTSGPVKESPARGENASGADTYDPATSSTARFPESPAMAAPADQESRRHGFRLTPARILAAGGALVTILGVGFLLAVAIAAGLFGPVPRVVSLALLAGGLAFGAHKLRDHSPEAGTALAATSTVASFGVVVAMTTIYAWLPPLAGVVAGLLITAAGLLVAHRWRNQLLAGLVHAQVLVVLPIILSPLDNLARVQLMVFTLIAFLPTVAAVVTHRWTTLFRFASVTVLLVAATGLVGNVTGLIRADESAWANGELIRIAVSIGAAVVVALIACLVDDAPVVAIAGGTSALAVTVFRMQIERTDASRLDVMIAAALAVVFAVAAWRYRDVMRAVLVVVASVHLFLATAALPIDREVIALLVAVEALALLAASRAPHAKAVWGTSVVLTGIAVLGLMGLVAPWVIVSTSTAVRAGRWEGIAVGIVVALVGALHARWATLFPVGGNVEFRSLAGAALAVYGVSSAIVTVGILPGVHPVVTMSADVLVTIVWVGVAIAMLRHPSASIRKAGYLLLAISVGKLFLADLHTVDGILRALLFVLTGLGLIGAATQIRPSDEPEAARDPEAVGG